MPLVSTLNLLAVLFSLWLVFRLYAARATFSSMGLLVYFTFGCVGSTLIALYLQAIPTPWPPEEGNAFASALPATWLTGPPIEEFAKAIPLFVLVAFAPAARRMAIADFALVGFTTALGFGFVEANFGRVLTSDVGGWNHLLGLGWDTGARGAYTIYDAPHWIHTALVGLAFGVGLRLWPTSWKRWAPGVAMLAIAVFDHSMWNFKAEHEWPNSFTMAAAPVEALYNLTLHGGLEIIALPLLLIVGTWWESRRLRQGAPNLQALQLPGESQGLRGEVSLLVSRHTLGIGALRRTLAYFRHRRAYLLALADPTSDGYPAVARRRLDVERAQVASPAPTPWPPTAAQTVAWLKSFAKQFRIPLAISALSLLVFGVAPHFLPWLHASNLAWLAALVAVGFTGWRIHLYRRAPAPTPGEAGGEQLAQRRTRALLLCASVASTGIPIVTLLLRRQPLTPDVHLTFIAAYVIGWIAAGGSPLLLSALGGAAAAATIAPEPAPPCDDLRREAQAGADRVSILAAQIQTLSSGDADIFNGLINKIRPGIHEPGHPEGWICGLPAALGSRSAGFQFPWETPAPPPVAPGGAPVSVDTATFEQLWSQYAAERAAQASRESALDICMGQAAPIDATVDPGPAPISPEPSPSGPTGSDGHPIPDRPLGEEPADGGDHHTQERPGTGAPGAKAGREAANAPPAPTTQDADQSDAAQAGRDAANLPPTPATHDADQSAAAQAGRDAANAPLTPAQDGEPAKASDDTTDNSERVEIPPDESAPPTQERDGTGAGDPAAGRDAANAPSDLAATPEPGPAPAPPATADPAVAAPPPEGSLAATMDPRLRNILDRQKAGDPAAAADLKAYKDSVADTPLDFGDRYMRALTGIDEARPLDAEGSAAMGAKKLASDAVDFAEKVKDGVVNSLEQVHKAAGLVDGIVAGPDGAANLWDAVKHNPITDAVASVPDLFKGSGKLSDFADGATRTLIGDDPNHPADDLGQAVNKKLADTYQQARDTVNRLLGDPDKVQDALSKGTVEAGGNAALGKLDNAVGDLSTIGEVTDKAAADAAARAALEKAGGGSLGGVTPEEERIANATTQATPAAGHADTEVGAGRTTVNEPQAVGRADTEIGAGRTTVNEPQGADTEVGAGRTTVGEPQVAGAAESKPEPVGRQDGLTEPGAARPAAPPPALAPADHRVILHTEDGKAYELGGGEVNPDGSPLTPPAEAPRVEPAGRAERAGEPTVVDPPKTPGAPPEDQRIIIHTEEGKAYEFGGGEVSPDGSPLTPHADAPRIDPTGVTQDVSPAPDAPPADQRIIIHTEDGKAYEFGGGEVNPDGSPLTPHAEAPGIDPKGVTQDVPPATTQALEPAQMPGDKPTGPTGTEVLQPHEPSDAGKTPALEHPAPAPEAPPANDRRANWRAAQARAAGELPDAHYQPYADGIQELRAAPGSNGLPHGPDGPCEATKSLLTRPEYEGARPAMVKVGELNHEIIITKEGNVVDPFARQAVRDGFVSAEHVRSNNLGGAIEKGMFTPEQWKAFSGAAPPPRLR